MRAIYINGRFTTQPLTGVQRVAHELIHAMDSLPQLLSRRKYVLLLPPGVKPPELRQIEIRHIGFKWLSHHAWEQIVLPQAAQDGVLLNLSGGAPWHAKRQVVLLHDAAVFDRPEAYTPLFVWWYRNLFRHLARRETDVWSVSDFSRSRLALHLGLNMKSIGHLPLGADHLKALPAKSEVLNRLGLASGEYLLSVASDNPSKNLEALLQALRQLPTAGARKLVIVGRRNSRVFAATGSYPDPPCVVRAGPTCDEEPKALYEHATALVVPSVYEGFGLPAVEAMSCGCPVVAARAASLPEVCGDAALYFDPLSIPDIARALRQVQTDSSLRKGLVMAGAKRAQQFRWEQSAQTLLAGLTSTARL